MHLRTALFSCCISLACLSLGVQIPGRSTSTPGDARSASFSISSSSSASNSSTSAPSTSSASRSTSRPKSGSSSSATSTSSLTSVTLGSSSATSRGTGSGTSLSSLASTSTSLSISSSSSALTSTSLSTSSSSSAFTSTSPSSSSSFSSTNTSPSSSTSSIPQLTTSSSSSVIVTTTICCHSTVDVFIGAFIFGGSDGGGVADVRGTLLNIPEGDTDEVIEPPGGGPPELSSITQSTITITTGKSTTTTSATSTSASTSNSSSSSSSSSATASVSPYVIVPKAGTPASQEATFQKRLEALSVEPIEAILGTSDEIDFWLATLTPGNATLIGDDEVVSYYYLDAILNVDRRCDVGQAEPENSLESRDLLKRNEIPPKGFNIQQSCRRELSMVSQPPNVPLAPLPPDINPKNDPGIYNYNYVDSIVPDVWVYLIDDGANPDHPEYKFMRGKKAWSLLADGAIKNDPTSHGSCMLSKIAGPTFGTAKSVNVAIIKITKDQEMENSSLWLRAFRKVLDSVVKKGRQGRAVINFSRSSRMADQETSHFSEDLYNVLSDLIQQDVVIVCASGNFRTSHPSGETGKISDTINSIPALFGVPGSTLHGGPLELIVVGAVDANGARTRYSQGPAAQLGVSAVGNSLCAYGVARNGNIQQNQWLTGTSVATAQVAGQVAVMLSNPDAYGLVYEPGAGKTAQKVKAIIQEAAYPRVDGGPPVLWNNVDLVTCPRRPPGALRQKRQAGGSSTSTDIPMCAISYISSSTSTIPTTTTSSSSSSSSLAYHCPTEPAFLNPGFESGSFGAWSTGCADNPCDPPAVEIVSSDKPHSSSYAAEISNTAAGDSQFYTYFYIYQDLSVCSTGNYRLNFWAMSNDSVDCAGCCFIVSIVNGQVASNYIDVYSSYAQYSVNIGYFTFGGPTTLRVGLADDNCYTQGLYLDDFSITVS